MSKSEKVQQHLQHQRYIHSEVTCGELLDIQREFYKSHFNFIKITEFMVHDIIEHFYTEKGDVNKLNATLYLNKKYKGALSYLGKDP